MDEKVEEEEVLEEVADLGREAQLIADVIFKFMNDKAP